MPYVDTVGDVLRCTIAAIYPTNQVEECNFHLQCVVSGGGDSRAALGNAIDTAVQADIIPHLHSAVLYYGSRVAIEQAANKWGSAVSVVNTPGGSTDPSLPGQVRGLLRLRTALVGRKQRGRLFMFTPITTMADTNGVPTVTYQNQIQTFGTRIQNGFTAGGSQWVSVIYHRPPKTNPAAWTVTSTTAITPANKFATQRRSSEFGRVNVNPW